MVALTDRVRKREPQKEGPATNRRRRSLEAPSQHRPQSSSLCFALHSDDQKRTAFRYAVSLFQLEYSRNFLFERGRDLEQMFQGLIERTRATLDIKTVKTILGRKRRPKKNGTTRWEITVETPEYGLTVFADSCRDVDTPDVHQRRTGSPLRGDRA